jgi:hypothetical protein
MKRVVLFLATNIAVLQALISARRRVDGRGDWVDGLVRATRP